MFLSVYIPKPEHQIIRKIRMLTSINHPRLRSNFIVMIGGILVGLPIVWNLTEVFLSISLSTTAV